MVKKNRFVLVSVFTVVLLQIGYVGATSNQNQSNASEQKRLKKSSSSSKSSKRPAVSRAAKPVKPTPLNNSANRTAIKKSAKQATATNPQKPSHQSADPVLGGTVAPPVQNLGTPSAGASDPGAFSADVLQSETPGGTTASPGGTTASGGPAVSGDQTAQSDSVGSVAGDATSDEEEIDSETPVVIEEIAGDMNLTGQRPWRATDYDAQPAALGLTSDTFEVPRGLEKNFQFWLDIYTKYTTDQGVLHDSENLGFIYNALDFSHIASRGDVKSWQKEHLRKKAVNDAKKSIHQLLDKLHATKDPSTLSGEERRIWDQFASDPDPRKFLEAKSKSRLRFQLGQRDRLIQGIFFSGRYLEDFERIFKEENVPLQLTRLPFVESSFNVLARSKVGASGLWQIMRYTANKKLMMNDAIDKRNHPSESARMAARYLKSNYVMLQSWPLAITGYNHGPSGVQRLARYHRTNDLGELAQKIDSKKRLGFASRNFYVSFLAVVEAERKANYYFGSVAWSQPLAGKDIRVGSPIYYKDILRWFDGDARKAEIFNPHITSAAKKFGRPIPPGAMIMIPDTKVDEIVAEFQSRREALKIRTHRKPSQASSNSVAGAELSPAINPVGVQTYRVQKGDSAWSIARDFGVSVRELVELNQLKSPSSIRVDQVLQIP